MRTPPGVSIGVANLVRPTLVLIPIVVRGLFVHRLGWRRGSALGAVGVATTLLLSRARHSCLPDPLPLI